ncbi:MAG: hypothetical protein GX845_04800 [Erysipelothrix sp.]|nr:hypothetical protein [Erysipelothrix sp.]
MFNLHQNSQQLCLWCVRPRYHDACTWDLLYHHPYLCNACAAYIKKPIHFHMGALPCTGMLEYDLDVASWLFRYKEDCDVVMAPSFFYGFKRRIKKHKDWVFVMMPSSASKTKERGFHPLHSMLQPYAKNISWALFKETDAKQTTLPKSLRQHVQIGIDPLQRASLTNKKVVLVDDVMTTGSTMSAAYALFKDITPHVKCMVFAVHPKLIEKNNYDIIKS